MDRNPALLSWTQNPPFRVPHLEQIHRLSRDANATGTLKIMRTRSHFRRL